ncbi:unnamed protein product [Heterobilharzia americana]|nr:unnamed protein product [Heterobilharzia americana]
MPSPTTQIADIGTSLTNGSDIEQLKKHLPHVDFETGLRHRTIRRDPITGLGTLPKEHIELGRTRNSSVGRLGFNSTLIAWDADNAATVCQDNGHCPKKTKQPTRNPIALTGILALKWMDCVRQMVLVVELLESRNVILFLGEEISVIVNGTPLVDTMEKLEEPKVQLESEPTL